MKIVSLQSVGLGAVFSGGEHVNGFGFNEPYTITIGKDLYDGRGYSLDVRVNKIEILCQKTEINVLPQFYTVKTSDGHVRVLPADKYIAEWSE